MYHFEFDSNLSEIVRKETQDAADGPEGKWMKRNGTERNWMETRAHDMNDVWKVDHTARKTSPTLLDQQRGFFHSIWPMKEL